MTIRQKFNDSARKIGNGIYNGLGNFLTQEVDLRKATRAGLVALVLAGTGVSGGCNLQVGPGPEFWALPGCESKRDYIHRTITNGKRALSYNFNGPTNEKWCIKNEKGEVIYGPRKMEWSDTPYGNLYIGENIPEAQKYILVIETNSPNEVIEIQENTTGGKLKKIGTD